MTGGLGEGERVWLVLGFGKVMLWMGTRKDGLARSRLANGEVSESACVRVG